MGNSENISLPSNYSAIEKIKNQTTKLDAAANPCCTTLFFLFFLAENNQQRGNDYLMREEVIFILPC